ncbi:MAG TPA: MarC family NAAT transporter [Ignavibacteriaceae bacterium]|nr:MarC family NAAT transporter [Ignavibacteriaceae bacterium]
MNDITAFLSSVLVTLVTLLPIINPVSTAILLLGISEHLTKKDLNRQIIMACIYMTGILVVFLLAGHFIMIFFGISIPGIRIAGGMVIGFLGFKMLFPGEAKITQAEKQEAIKKSNISFSPLAMPSLAGPGAIATVITISSSIDGRHGYDKVFAFAGVILAIVVTAIISWLVLRSAGFVSRILGVNGVDSLSRIMGFLLICIGIQFVIIGVQDLISDTGFWQKL